MLLTILPLGRYHHPEHRYPLGCDGCTGPERCPPPPLLSLLTFNDRSQRFLLSRSSTPWSHRSPAR